MYYVLHGTVLLVYKFDPHRIPVKMDSAKNVPMVSEADSEEFLHVHIPGERRPSATLPPPSTGPAGVRWESVGEGGPGARRTSASGPTFVGSAAATASEGVRRASVSSSTASMSTTSTTSSAEKDASLFSATGPRRASISTASTGSQSSTAAPKLASHFQNNQLVKAYTLQNAESGLAADYVKKKNVVRVRAQGEQFLLQTDDAREVVDWIEVSVDSFVTTVSLYGIRRFKRQQTSLWILTTDRCRRSSPCLVVAGDVRPVLLPLMQPRTRQKLISQRCERQKSGTVSGCWQRIKRERRIEREADTRSDRNRHVFRDSSS